MHSVDVTHLVNFENPDDECLPLTSCICGKEFDAWEVVLSIYEDDAWECDCGAELYFESDIKVFNAAHQYTRKI
jgi:hypothetical protein